MCNKVLGSNKSCVVIGLSDKISLELEADKLIGLRSESRALGRAVPGPVWFLRLACFSDCLCFSRLMGPLLPTGGSPFHSVLTESSFLGIHVFPERPTVLLSRLPHGELGSCREAR